MVSSDEMWPPPSEAPVQTKVKKSRDVQSRFSINIYAVAAAMVGLLGVPMTSKLRTPPGDMFFICKVALVYCIFNLLLLWVFRVCHVINRWVFWFAFAVQLYCGGLTAIFFNYYFRVMR